MAVYDEGFAPQDSASRAGSFVNFAGAALSLTLIVGVGFWGYKLVMRDVSGIPVVRAMEGDMRVLPDNPGGDVALHTGLAVNEVAAVGEAGGPEDRLVLAPATSGLTTEDFDVQPSDASENIAPAPEVGQVPVNMAAPDVPAAAFEDPANADILALADQIAADVAAVGTGIETGDETDVIAPSVPGVVMSQRPVLRPAGLQATVASSATATVRTDEVAISTTEFAAGTNLVQLGAFPSPTLAAEEWRRLQGTFGQLMTDKGRVIQVSNQSSGTWYRLRASGFTDRAEARRFCTALEAEGANCIAVLVN
ncbi:SPOR domain-containing protein [Yoonia sp.]|uniref:SPOR domain-containing protein n=1 Tax=Yoonia sp. TaxID=2212373 RepID=UPI003F6B91AA